MKTQVSKLNSSNSSVNSGFMLAIVANILWGTTFLASKYTLQAWGPFTSAALRFGIATFCVYAILKGLRRRRKDEVSEDKFFIDVSKNKEQKELIQGILNQANNKNYGREIILKDLILISLPKITPKEIERLQENSLSEMEKVAKALDEYNKKADIKLTLGEFLVKKLALQ